MPIDNLHSPIEKVHKIDFRVSFCGHPVHSEFCPDDIHPLLREEQNHVQISVIDQGVGIPKEELENIFDEFIQSSKTRDGAGGTGLGLSISRRIILAHQGNILAEPNPSDGSIVQFTISKHLDKQEKSEKSNQGG